MLRKFSILLVLSLIALAFGVASLQAKSSLDKGKRYVDVRTNQVKTYSFNGRQPVTRDNVPEVLTPTSPTRDSRVSLGVPVTAGTNVDAGMTVDISYNDDQYVAAAPRNIGFGGPNPDIIFVYSNADAKTDATRYGFNSYDPVAGNWPNGNQQGCEVQAAGDVGAQTDLAITTAGKVVIAGVEGADTAVMDNHYYFPQTRFSCTFNTGSVIAPSQYNVNFLISTNKLRYPRVESQTIGDTTWTHVAAVEQHSKEVNSEWRSNTLHYFRKPGTTQAGTWQGPVTIDTIACPSNEQRENAPSIAASRVSSSVAIAYVMPTPTGLANNQRYDCDIYYAQSTDGGKTWAPGVNVTNFQRNVASKTSFMGAQAFYDSQGFLHIIFDGNSVPADVYSPTSSYFWGDFSTSLYHWSKRVAGTYAGGSLAKIHNAEWGIEQNTLVCGFGSPGSGYAGFYSVGECDGRLYVTFTQFLDYFGLWGPSQIDDCAVGATDRQYAANGEVAVCVSADLDGMLWDAARNLTNTYTPDCDSAGGLGGECANDGHATISRYGMNANSYGTPLIWPGTDLVVPAGGTADSMFIQVFYTADKFPSVGWRATKFGKITPNPLKWMRMACVDPIQAPKIMLEPSLIAYPDWTKHGVAKPYTVTVTNEGNQDLHISKIQPQLTSPLTPNWMTVSTATLTVPAGQLNTATFNLTLNAGGLINSPGTVKLLNGEVYILSDATAPRDSVSIFIENFVVADTVVGLSFDTVVSCGVKLMVDNHGDMGSQGQGKVNLDFIGNGECNTGADVYLYDGGPIVIRNLGGGNFVYSNALFEDLFNTAQSFKPYAGPASGSFVGTGYDGYFTGTFVTRDTAIGVQLRYFGPTTGTDCDFIIQQMKVFKMTPGSLTNVTVGQGIDWDIWSDSGTTNSYNVTGKSDAGGFVYQRGVDTGAVTGCNPDSGRFGAQAVLAVYKKSDSLLNNCVDSGFHGMYAQYNDSLFKYDTLSEALEATWYWNNMDTLTGLRTRPGVRDFHMITTYKKGTTITNTDTLTCWTAVTSVRNGTLADLEANVTAAKAWFIEKFRPGCGGCCKGFVGNADNSGDDVVDVGDLTALIDILFINFPPMACPAECNCDGSGDGVVDVGDLTALIDNLFINFTALPACP